MSRHSSPHDSSDQSRDPGAGAVFTYSLLATYQRNFHSRIITFSGTQITGEYSDTSLTLFYCHNFTHGF